MRTSVTDFSALGDLKRLARDDRDAALRKVAQEFESLFIGLVLKSMRQAAGGKGAFDNQQSLMFRDLYDKQTAVEMSRAGGIGLADVIVRQLGRNDGAASATGGVAPEMPKTRIPSPLPLVALPSTRPDAPPGRPLARESPSGFDSPEDFIRTLRPAARAAASRLGVAPEALLAQAALESGWGRHLIRKADGSPAHNLFGIKADARWGGGRAVVRTLEYEQGVAVRKQAAFRAYDSWKASFDDYAEFLLGNPRYHEALENRGDPHRYLRALQRAGYATDPHYADKIIAILDSERLRAGSES